MCPIGFKDKEGFQEAAVLTDRYLVSTSVYFPHNATRGVPTYRFGKSNFKETTFYFKQSFPSLEEATLYLESVGRKFEVLSYNQNTYFWGPMKYSPAP